jgi:hypothetical protein
MDSPVLNPPLIFGLFEKTASQNPSYEYSLDFSSFSQKILDKRAISIIRTILYMKINNKIL